MSADDDRGRYAVRFSGEITKDAARALRVAHMGLQRRDTFFDAPVPYSTTVVLRASGEADAVERVREALEGAGEFSGFEAVAFSRPAADEEDG
jgi:hypothetical protein